MKNKTAFTMIEVLAVVVLLGILAGIALPSIQKYMQEAETKYNKEIENQLLISGKNYFSENRNLLPKLTYLDKINMTENRNYVTFAQLATNNLVNNELVDYKGRSCRDSYIVVVKNSTNKEELWYPCLICGEGNDKDMYSDNPYCSFNANWDDKEKPTCKLVAIKNNTIIEEEQDQVFNSKNAEFKFKELKDMLSNDDDKNYSSIIFQNNTTGSMFHKKVNDNTQGDIKNMNLKNMMPEEGTYSISVVDKGANSALCINNVIIDNTKPECQIKIEETSEEWPKQKTLISTAITENEKIYDKPYLWNWETGTIKTEFSTKNTYIANKNGSYTSNIKDKAGNVNECSILINGIDTVKPDIPTYVAKFEDGSGTYKSGTWTNKKVLTTISTKDELGEIKEIQYQKLGTTTWNTFAFKSSPLTKNGDTYQGTEAWDLFSKRNDVYHFRACDKAGNCSDASKKFNIKYDIDAPTKPTITRTDYNTFSYTATDDVGVTGYYVSTSSTAPTTNSTWTKTTTKNISSATTYYVWARDEAGNISAASSIKAYKISRSQGTGTTLITKYDTTSANSGTEFTSSTVMLSGTPIWAKSTTTSQYNQATLKHGSTTMTASGDTFTVNKTETITSSATANTAKITINKDGSAYSGLTVALYQSGSSKYSSPSYSSGKYTFSAVANGTYDIYIGETDTGTDVTISSNSGTATINYYTLTITKGTGISSVTGPGTYISGKKVPISATATSGYTFSSWTKNSGNAPASTTSASTTVTITATTSLTANAADKEKPTAPTITRTDYNTFSYSSTDNIKVTGYYVSTSSTKPTTSSSWVTTTTKDVSSAGTYYVWARDAAGNISDASSIAAYTISRSEGTGTTLTTRYDSTSSSTGKAFTSSTVMLKGTSVWAKSVASTGYSSATLKHGSTTMTASGASFTVSTSETITSAATKKTKSITYQIAYDTSKYSGPSSSYSTSTYQTISKTSSSLSYGSSETITASPAYPDDRYNGSISCTNGITASPTTIAAGSSTTRTDTITFTNNSDTTTASVCTITYTPKWEGVAYGSYTAGNTLSYGGSDSNWTIKKDNGDNIGLAYNALSGHGKYEDAPATLKTNILDKYATIKNDYNNGGLISQNGNYITSNSGISTNLTIDNEVNSNYWVTSSTFYNRKARNRYEITKYQYVDGASNGYDVEVTNLLPAKLFAHSIDTYATIGEGIRNISGTYHSTSNGVVTLEKASYSNSPKTTYYSRWAKELIPIPGNSNHVGFASVAWKLTYDSVAKTWSFVTTYEEDDNHISSTNDDVFNTFRITAYICGGTNSKGNTNHGKKIVYRYKDSTEFYYGNQVTGTGWGTGTNFTLNDAVSRNYENAAENNWFGAFAGLANTWCTGSTRTNCPSSEDKTISSHTRYHRYYKFSNYASNKYCYQPNNYSVSDYTFNLYYRPYIIVRER